MRRPAGAGSALLLLPLLLASARGVDAPPTREPRSEPVRWAVLVGVSDYAEFGDDAGGDLRGAAADAERLRNVLVERWGFSPERMRVLLDGAATRAGIEAALREWLPAVVQPGDLVVFYFSGHGAQAWDLDGDEPDGLDETIAPHDVMRTSPERDIRDDELRVWFDALPTRNVVAILDNCHAGTGTRAPVPFARVRALARRPDDLPRPGGTRGSTAAGDVATGLFGAGVLELSAAQADQAAVESAWPSDDGESWGGAFTMLLVQQLWMASPQESYATLFRHTAHQLSRHGFEQAPWISNETGSGRLAVFGFEPVALAVDVAPPEWNARLHGDVLVVSGGGAAGISEGMLLEGPDILARVTTATRDSAVAAVLPGSDPAGGALAVRPAAVRLEPARLEVDLSGLVESDRARVGAALRVDARFGLLQRPTPRSLGVRSVPGGYDVIGRDGALRHSVRGTATDALDGLRQALTREADAAELAAVRNAARPFAADVALAARENALHVGDPVVFTVRSERDGFVTLVDLGTDGTITVLFPLGGEDGRITSGSPLRVPTAAMQAAGIVFEAQPPEGAGLLRAFVTARPLALPSDAAPLSASAVLDALAAAVGPGPLGEPGTLGLRDWADATLEYTIRR